MPESGTYNTHYTPAAHFQSSSSETQMTTAATATATAAATTTTTTTTTTTATITAQIRLESVCAPCCLVLTGEYRVGVGCDVAGPGSPDAIRAEMEEDRDFTERVWAEVRKRLVSPHVFSILKMIGLPRQALDTHRESSQEGSVSRRRSSWTRIMVPAETQVFFFLLMTTFSLFTVWFENASS
eukprot:COSAG06_NODE_2440_length_6872_cov_135.458586_9_plen_183_part_00